MPKEKFKAKPGQVDYSNARWAPIINCVLRHNGKILLLRRSSNLRFYPGFWNGVSGFLDDHKSLKEKVTEEIFEELGLPKSRIKKIVLGEIFDQEAPKYKKTWIVHPILVEVDGGKIKLDWESRDFKWVALVEAKKMKLLPGFGEVLERVAGKE